MAGGGTFTTKDKVLPGYYFNFETKGATSVAIGTKGTVAIAKILDWGPNGFFEITDPINMRDVFGYGFTEDQSLFIRELFKGTSLTSGCNKALIYRMTDATSIASTGTIGKLIIAGKYTGIRGNDITCTIQPYMTTTTEYSIVVTLAGAIVETLVVRSATSTSTEFPTILDCKSNWIAMTGEIDAEAVGILPLAGGANCAYSALLYNEFLSVVSKQYFDVLIYEGTKPDTDILLIDACVNLVKRLNEEEGRYCIAVVPTQKNYDSELVVSCTDSVVLDTGETITSNQIVWWLGGVQSGALYNQSLTTHDYPSAVSCSPIRENSELEEVTLKGRVCLYTDRQGVVLLLTDINNLISFTQKKNKTIRKNRVVRTIHQIASDLKANFDSNISGKEDANDSGLLVVKSQTISYLQKVQNLGGIRGFDPAEVSVTYVKGEVDAIEIAYGVIPVDSIEKIYTTLNLLI